MGLLQVLELDSPDGATTTSAWPGAGSTAHQQQQQQQRPDLSPGERSMSTIGDLSAVGSAVRLSAQAESSPVQGPDTASRRAGPSQAWEQQTPRRGGGGGGRLTVGDFLNQSAGGSSSSREIHPHHYHGGSGSGSGPGEDTSRGSHAQWAQQQQQPQPRGMSAAQGASVQGRPLRLSDLQTDSQNPGATTGNGDPSSHSGGGGGARGASTPVFTTANNSRATGMALREAALVSPRAGSPYISRTGSSDSLGGMYAEPASRPSSGYPSLVERQQQPSFAGGGGVGPAARDGGLSAGHILRSTATPTGVRAASPQTTRASPARPWNADSVSDMLKSAAAVAAAPLSAPRYVEAARYNSDGTNSAMNSSRHGSAPPSSRQSHVRFSSNEGTAFDSVAQRTGAADNSAAFAGFGRRDAPAQIRPVSRAGADHSAGGRSFSPSTQQRLQQQQHHPPQHQKQSHPPPGLASGGAPTNGVYSHTNGEGSGIRGSSPVRSGNKGPGVTASAPPMSARQPGLPPGLGQDLGSGGGFSTPIVTRGRFSLHT